MQMFFKLAKFTYYTKKYFKIQEVKTYRMIDFKSQQTWFNDAKNAKFMFFALHFIIYIYHRSKIFYVEGS